MGDTRPGQVEAQSEFVPLRGPADGGKGLWQRRDGGPASQESRKAGRNSEAIASNGSLVPGCVIPFAGVTSSHTMPIPTGSTGNWITMSASRFPWERDALEFVRERFPAHEPHLRSPVRKDGFLEEMRTLAAALAVELVAWVILDEHYHTVTRPTAPENFNLWLGTLHSRSALRWNQEDGCARRQVWQNYWDKTLWTEGDLWTRINYVHRNPGKHGCTDDPTTWHWSSLNAPELRWDADETQELIRRFPAPLRLPDDD